LYKQDALLSLAEQLITDKKAWAPISGSTKRVESKAKVSVWLADQERAKRALEARRGSALPSELKLSDFPEVETDTTKVVITTSKNIAYLMDSCPIFLDIIEKAFGSDARRKASNHLVADLPVFLYMTNSVASDGRAFSGDPFTGQCAAYSRIFAFDMLGN